MARQLKWWLGLTLLACAGIGLLYLPPRGITRERRPRQPVPQLTAARLRAQALANQWRVADLAVRLADYRRELEPELARRRTAGQAGPVLLFEGTDTVPDAARRTLRAALDTVWRRLGLGVTKVSVGVVFDMGSGRPPTSANTPRENRSGLAYLLPDSTDRATCIVLIRSPSGYRWIRPLLTAEPPAGDHRLTEWLKNGLGPCAFYAAYGTPSRPVRRWLARRKYDVALYPDWDGQGPERWAGWPLVDPGNKRWYWDAVYRVPPRAAACLGGRADACRAAVLESADHLAQDSLPRVLAPEARWWREQRLVHGHRYLADVAREVGRERFLRFWNSPLPVDSALALAVKAPVGEWTERWQRRFTPRLPVGASVPPSAAVLGMLLAGVALTTVALSVSRREVR